MHSLPSPNWGSFPTVNSPSDPIAAKSEPPTFPRGGGPHLFYDAHFLILLALSHKTHLLDLKLSLSHAAENPRQEQRVQKRAKERMGNGMHNLFKSPFFDFETIRILGTTAYGGADIAEVLEAIAQIKDNDPTTWAAAWRVQADRAQTLAQEASQHGDRDAACRGYLRASNYTRASGYMYTSTLDANGSPVQDRRALPIAEKVNEMFRKAIPLMEGAVHELKIPYEDYILPGFLYLPPAQRRIPGRKKIPILVNSGGADSCQEELFYLNPAAGPGLGYAVVTFDGPGQGIMLRRYGLEMRPDWETVTGKVIDFLEKYARDHPKLDLDLDAVSVSGASMGGYYSLRAASDPRVKACVAIVSRRYTLAVRINLISVDLIHSGVI